ncbi:MAG: carbon-nitrogen hydrolase [Actinobacteria bacterium]|nr:carbon-nitrogen hydrolase [Actinomycetota bacterium]|tara:strand:- start:3433 stop:4197 length:765 start_codon:yes stop_codon:yes gene_type:complete
MKVAGVQHDIVWEDKEKNFTNIRPLISQAAESSPDLIILTELFSTGFSMSTEMIGEDIDGPSTSFLVNEAEKTGIPICGSVPALADGHKKPHNYLVVAYPDNSVESYAKKHLFSFAKEDNHYRPGQETLTLNFAGTAVSFFICFDLRFAPDFWDLAPKTDLYVVIANWPETRAHHWKSLLTARAIENQAYVMGVNRVGSGDGIRYSGDSRLIDPLGTEVVAANSGLTEILVGEVSSSVVSEVRSQYPFLNDRSQ